METLHRLMQSTSSRTAQHTPLEGDGHLSHAPSCCKTHALQLFHQTHMYSLYLELSMPPT